MLGVLSCTPTLIPPATQAMPNFWNRSTQNSHVNHYQAVFSGINPFICLFALFVVGTQST